MTVHKYCNHYSFRHKNPEDPSEVPGGFVTDCNKVRWDIQTKKNFFEKKEFIWTLVWFENQLFYFPLIHIFILILFLLGFPDSNP